MTQQVRVVLHAHSKWSYDGHWSLARIARLYGALGVRAVMMTEHDTGFAPDRFGEYRAACAAASTRRCTLIPGIEYSCPDNDIHILTWGLEAFLAEHQPVQDTLAAVKAAGGVAVFAHPIRREAWRKFDPAWVPSLSGIELWNRKSDGISWSRSAQELIQSTGLPATVGQDFHRMRHFYPLSMALKAAPQADLEPQLVAAIKAGALVPQVFGGAVLDKAGQPAVPVHDRLETLRRTLRGRPALQGGLTRKPEESK